MNQTQSLDSIEARLESLLSSNSSRSLSGVFKALRKEQRISMIGDYPLLSFILDYGYSRTPRYVWNRNQVLRAVRVSGFYKDIPRKNAYIPKNWEKYISDSRNEE